MVSSLRGKFEASSKFNGVVVTYCADISNVTKYIATVAEREGTHEVIWAPPEPREQNQMLEELNHRGIEPVTRDIRTRIMDTPVAVTGGDGGIAETGTLIINSSLESTRLAISLSTIHIAVLEVGRLVATMEDAISVWDINVSRRSRPSCWSFISGPGKTLSIEQTPITGILGPREFHILMI